MGKRNKKITWFLTYPQHDGEPNELLEHIKTIGTIKEYVIAQELHKDGNKHLHAYIKFEEEGIEPKSAVVVFDFKGKHGNYQPARSCKGVIRYCTKGANYITNINVESYMKKKGKVLAETVKNVSTVDALTEGIISFTQARAYQYARSILQDPYEHDDVRGLWIYGPPGTGKSHFARERGKIFGGYYMKPQNKWFDGYNGERVIILDDMDKKGTCLDHYMKIWTDRYACSGEIKGGTVQLQHEEFIVTSNYTIEELFGEFDDVIIEAISRRFKKIHIPCRTQVPDVYTLKKDINQVLKPRREDPLDRTGDPIPTTPVGDNRMSFDLYEVYGKIIRRNPT